MLTCKQTAARLILCDSRVRQLCIQGRLPGAVKVGRDWFIPDDSVYSLRKPGRKPNADNRKG